MFLKIITYSILLFSFHLLYPVNSSSQNILLLRKKGEYRKKIIFQKEDVITFQMKDEKFWLTGKIDSIGNDFIKINHDNTEIKISDIIAVQTHRSNFNFKAGGTQLVVAGIIAPLISVANGIANHDRHLIAKEFIFFSAGVILTGFVLKILALKTYRTNNNKELKIVQF